MNVCLCLKIKQFIIYLDFYHIPHHTVVYFAENYIIMQKKRGIESSMPFSNFVKFLFEFHQITPHAETNTFFVLHISIQHNATIGHQHFFVWEPSETMIHSLLPLIIYEHCHYIVPVHRTSKPKELRMNSESNSIEYCNAQKGDIKITRKQQCNLYARWKTKLYQSCHNNQYTRSDY